jgi:indole-3-glycerol phosphate synthase
MQIRRRLASSQENGYEIAEPEAQPQNILEKIVWHKELEIAQIESGEIFPGLLDKIEDEINHAPHIRDFRAALWQSPTKPALIAEVKKASPSKGIIKQNFDPVAIAAAYERGGASCLSVLTDTEFFQGGFENLRLIRQAVNLPLLCKEFIIDPWQVAIARIHGADAVLLIAAILSDYDLAHLLECIHAMNMTALVEVHTASELERVLGLEGVQIIGINNRDLETFKVDLNTTKVLMSGLESDIRQNLLWVGESGIFTNVDLEFLATCGVGAVLVGESLVKQDDIAAAVQTLIGKR